MGFFYTGRVYKEVVGTSPTEQTVLAYLAFRADDKTGQCFPSVERIMRETHFSRSAVIRALDGLKKREVLCWVKGGRTKGGRALSNLYTIKLPPVDKSVDKSVDNFMEDAREEKARVSQRHPAGSRRETMQGVAETLCRVSQRHPNIQITNIKQPVINITRPGGGKRPEPGRLDLGGKHREGVVSFSELLGEAPPPPPPQAVSPVMEAMEAAGVTDEDNKRVFSSVMMGLDKMQCREVICQFKSELRNGEMKNVRNLAALLMQRLKDIPRKEN